MTQQTLAVPDDQITMQYPEKINAQPRKTISNKNLLSSNMLMATSSPSNSPDTSTACHSGDEPLFLYDDRHL